MQESILGPLLFLIYIDNLWKDISSILKLFADNMFLFVVAKMSFNFDSTNPTQ